MRLDGGWPRGRGLGTRLDGRIRDKANANIYYEQQKCSK